MIKKYHRQENCLNVVAPKINSEISNEKLQVSHRMTIFTSEKFNCWMFQLHTQSSRLVKVVSTMGKYKQKFNRELLTLSTLSIFYGLKYKLRFSRETQNGSFITFWSVDNSKAKIISTGSISSIRFSFINPQLAHSFFKF